MLNQWLLAHRVYAAFLLGALYVGCWALLLSLDSAEVDTAERLDVLRWENGRLIAKLAQVADRQERSGGAQ